MAARGGNEAVLARRVRAQWLAERPGISVAAVATQTAGLQAQDPYATRLGVRVRSRRLTADAVAAAYAEPGVLVRTWLMRGTLHLVAAVDVRWMLLLFGDRNAAANARRRAGLGLDDATCGAALDALPRVLADGPLSRARLIERLAAEGVSVDPSGQAPAHLVAYAAARGVICRGPDVAKDEPGYVLLDDWAPTGRTLNPDAALGELARRYLTAYGPATAADLAAWSGLPLGTARRGLDQIGSELTELTPGAFVLTGSAAPPQAAEPVVRLLGAFDTYLLGYRSREDSLDPRFAERIQAGGGIVRAGVLVDGRIVGTWRHDRNRRRVRIEPFEPLDPSLAAALAAEVDDLGRFLGAEALGLG